MRLVLFTGLVMIAFAANSVLNRMALVGAETGPAAFALVRLGAGAVMLVVLANLRAGIIPWRAPGRVWGVAALALYVIGFSFAYVTLETGTGALILFGGVQITMFFGAVWMKEDMPPARWIGAIIAFAGLIVLLWPAGGAVPDIFGAVLMAAAALGWGVYSLLGRGGSNPLGATAANFALALPIGAICFLLLPDNLSLAGGVLAVISGAVTSGVGYALWYMALPKLAASVASVAQLSVPLIAVAGGLVFLGEPLSLRFLIAALLVLSGVVVSLRR